MTRFLDRLMAPALLALCALAPPATAGVEPVEPEVPAAIPATDEEVEKVLAAAEQAKKEKNDELMANVLFTMHERRSEQFVPWIEAGLKSKDNAILEYSIRAATAHDLEKHEKTVRKLFAAYAKKKDKKKKKKDDEADDAGSSRGVMIACIDYLAAFAVEGEEEAVHAQLDKLFASGGSPGSWATELVRSATLYLGRMKWMPCVPVLVDMVKEPYPENPNDPNNPPASYWEARYEIWHASEGWVRWALKEITGEQFRTHREWRAWANANEKKFK